MSDLETRFDTAMMDIYRRAKSEANYNAVRYFRMLSDHGGLETARILIHANAVSEGYTALGERGRLDLTVEALIYDHPEYHSLFSEEERAIVERRLREYQYAPVVGARKEVGLVKLDRIRSDPKRMDGQPCIRTLRLTVRRVLELVAMYPNREELRREFPELEDEDIRQALEYAAASLDDRVLELARTDETPT